MSVGVLLLCALNAHSKVTFEMAAEQDAAARAHNNSVNIGTYSSGIDPKSLQDDVAPKQWKVIWQGRGYSHIPSYRTKSISIPRWAKEVYVEYFDSESKATYSKRVTFPASSTNIRFAKSNETHNERNDRCSVDAFGLYKSRTVVGEKRTSWKCVTAVQILKVMAK